MSKTVAKSIWGMAAVYGVIMFGVLACAGPTVISTPNSCSTLLPTHWRDGVAGAELPSGDTVADWISFSDATVGKLDQANARTRDSIDIVSRCEERDKKSVEKSTRPWWKIF